MTASALDRKVTFQRGTFVPGPFGQEEVWQDVGGIYSALKQDVSDAEKARAGIVQATLSTRFQVRDTPFTRGITPRDRIICEGETFNITGVKEVYPGRRQLIEISAVRTA